MAIPTDFEYTKPATLEETVKLLADYQDRSKILAGGTDLANMLKIGFKVPELLIDIKGLDELKKIELKNDTLKIGSLVTFEQIINSDIIKEKMFVMWEAANLVASTGIRNRATMVGNICSAVPCLDSAGPLLVHEASILLASSEGERVVPVKEWFINPRKTALQANEFVTGVTIKIPAKKYSSAYQKMMRYSGEDLAQSNVSIIVFEDKTIRVAFGSVGPIPKRSPKIESFLNKNGLTENNINEAKKMIDTVITPITDVRASKEYRYHMTKVMFERGLKEAIKRLEELK